MGTNTILDAVLGYAAAGLSVLPIRTDGGKMPDLKSWTEYMTRPATEAELREWFRRPRGIGLACGAGSGGLELLDFDDDAVGEEWLQLMTDHYPDLLRHLVTVKSPRGLHVWYRVEGMVIPGNIDLAHRPTTEEEQAEAARQKKRAAKKKALIQTRGQGGQGIVPGGAPGAHPTKRPYVLRPGPTFAELPNLDPGERDTLHNLARMLDRMPPDKVAPARPARGVPHGADDLPGTDFDRRGDWAAILEPHGWRRLFTRGEVEYWQRPGKDDPGHSATLGHCKGQDGTPLLRVFSSNAEPFVDGKSYGKFNAYTLLNHHGDHTAAAKELARQGYGERHEGGKTTTGGSNKPTGTGEGEPSKLRVRPLTAFKIRPVEYLAKPYLPRGKLIIFAGVVAVGKTTLVRHMVASLSRGDAIHPGFSPPDGPCSCMWYTQEEGVEDTLKPGYVAAGGEQDRLLIIEGMSRGEAFTLHHLDAFRASLDEHQKLDVRVAVLDPITSLIAASGADSNVEGDVRPLLEALARLAEERDLSIIALLHLNKSTDSMFRLLGSIAYEAVPRLVLLTGRDPSDKLVRHVVPYKCNLPEEPPGWTFRVRLLTQDERSYALQGESLTDKQLDELAAQMKRLVWGDASTLDREDLLTPGRAARATQKSDDCEVWLTSLLSKGTLEVAKVEELAEAAGFSERTLNRVRSSLRKDGLQKARMGGRWYLGFGDPKDWDPPATADGRVP